MVVRAQCRGLLPDDAVSGLDVLLYTQGLQSPGSLTASPSFTSGRSFLSISGPVLTIFSTLHPDWCQTLGVVFSLMLIAPSWGGMLNGLLTLRGAWDKVRLNRSSNLWL